MFKKWLVAVGLFFESQLAGCELSDFDLVSQKHQNLVHFECIKMLSLTDRGGCDIGCFNEQAQLQDGRTGAFFAAVRISGTWAMGKCSFFALSSEGTMHAQDLDLVRVCKDFVPDLCAGGACYVRQSLFLDRNITCETYEENIINEGLIGYKMGPLAR